MKRIFFAKTKRDIKRYFSYLFDQGYTFREDGCRYEFLGDWKVVLESPKKLHLITIYSEREEINLAFAPAYDKECVIAIESMIHFLSQGKTFIDRFSRDLAYLAREKKKQYERLTKLLREYKDQIAPYFGEEFEGYRSDLLKAQNEYNRTLLGI